MGLTYNVYLTGDKIYGCRNCRAHLSTNNDMISKVSQQRSIQYNLVIVVSITAKRSPQSPKMLP